MVKDSIVIRVIPRPVPTVTLSDATIPFTTTSICRGSTVTLMAHGAGEMGHTIGAMLQAHLHQMNNP